MSTPYEVEETIERVCKKIGMLSRTNYFSIEYLEKIKYRKHNVLHSRFLGLLSTVGHELGYVVDVERGLKPQKSRKFNPDLLFWRNHRIKILFEYESTNSSDYRIIDKDLANYRRAVNERLSDDIELPKYWIIITTLPNKSVSSWSRWRVSKNDYTRLKGNPRSFYMKQFLREFSKLDKTNLSESRLFLLNLNRNGIAIEFPSSMSKNFPISWTRAGKGSRSSAPESRAA